MQTDLTTTHRHPQTYIPQIDSLRAIAVVAVIIYHLDALLLPGGFVGVDVFFVISGYVVSASLARDTPTSLRRFLASFYARRMVRIMPPLLACLIATSIAATLLIPNAWLSSTSEETAEYAFAGMSNFALMWSADDYFSPRAAYNPYSHTWSLGVEEQFYLLFPLLFFFCERLRQRGAVQSRIANVLPALLLTLSLAYGWYATIAAPAQAFYLLPSRFWELACGALLFQIQRHRQLVLPSTSGALWLGLALLATAFCLSTEQSFPFPWALLAVGGAALTIAGVTAPQANHALAARVLSHPALVFIGKRSYSLYLWHWPVMVLLRWTIGLQTPFQMALALALSAILACLSFSLLENPIRYSRLVLTQPRWRVIAAGLACVLLAHTLTTNVFARQQQISLSVTRDTRTWYPHAWPDKALQAHAQCRTKANVSRSDEGSITIYEPVDCTPPHAQPRQIFVIGDSHAGAYATLLYRLAEENAFRVLTYSRGGCGVANLRRPLADLQAECVTFVADTVQDIQRRANPGDVALLVALKLPRLGEQDSSYDTDVRLAILESEEAQVARRAALEDADELISTLEQRGLRVIIEAPKPLFSAPAFRCLDWFNRRNPICAGGLTMSREHLLKYRQPIMQALDTLSSKHQRLVVWDPFPVLCPRDPCTSVERAGPLFFDGDHLSAHGNRVLYPSLLKLLKQLWGTAG